MTESTRGSLPAGTPLPLEVRVHGRGGQGGVTCAKLIATIYAEQGLHVQTFGDYGSERTGDNMQTLHYMPVHKQLRIAQETLDIFAPLSNRLGIWQMKWELEDLAFSYVSPDKYPEISDNLAKLRSERAGNGRDP